MKEKNAAGHVEEHMNFTGTEGQPALFIRHFLMLLELNLIN